MASMGENVSCFRWAGLALGLAALLSAAACERETSEPNQAASERPEASEQPREAEDLPASAPAMPKSGSASAPEQPVTAIHDDIKWAGEAARCGTIVKALNDNAGFIQWTRTEENVETAELDYFNDGVVRNMERRTGMLAGNRIVTLWAGDGGGDFLRLDFGHAGANTKESPAIDNLHTKLTYSSVEIMDADEKRLTLVKPLPDIDPSGELFVIDWRAKDGRTAPPGPRDYYPYIECVLAPSGGED